MQPSEAMIETGERELAEVLADYHYVMPEGGMERVLRAALAQGAEAVRPHLGGRSNASEPFGYWITQKGCAPYFLRPPAYIPESGGPLERTVTPLFAREEGR